MIRDYAFHESNVLLALQDRIAVHDLYTGELQRETQIDTAVVGRILWEDNERYCLYDSVKDRFEFVSGGLNDWTLRTDKDNLLRWNVLRDEVRSCPSIPVGFSGTDMTTCCWSAWATRVA